MTKEDIIRMAREAGAVFPADGSYHSFEFEGSLERFAALVAAAEREECAKVADRFAVDREDEYICERLAEALRGRSKPAPKRTCPPCDSNCRQGRDCPAEGGR